MIRDKKHQKQRREMLDRQLVGRGIRDERVLTAMLAVPRHRFVPAELERHAYEDCPLPIGEGQTISQPYIVAAMTELLQVQPGDKVLEIGTGSGYQAAVLSEMGALVYTIEYVEELSRRAAGKLEALGVKNVFYKAGDGTLGWPEEAPFQGVIVTAGAPQVPPPLLKQLAEGGRMVLPLGGRYSQVLTRVTRRGEEFAAEEFFGCVFVPLLGRHGWND